MRSSIILLLLFFTLIASCGSGSKEEKELLAKAYEKQKEAIALLGELEVELEASIIQEKDSLLEVIEELEEGIFEIPGHHLELPGHEGHDHGHSRLELSAKEIFNVQEDLLKQLRKIQNTLNNQ